MCACLQPAFPPMVSVIKIIEILRGAQRQSPFNTVIYYEESVNGEVPTNK